MPAIFSFTKSISVLPAMVLAWSFKEDGGRCQWCPCCHSNDLTNSTARVPSSPCTLNNSGLPNPSLRPTTERESPTF